jgi:hypothetical protein
MAQYYQKRDISLRALEHCDVFTRSFLPYRLYLMGAGALESLKVAKLSPEPAARLPPTSTLWRKWPRGFPGWPTIGSMTLPN